MKRQLLRAVVVITLAVFAPAAHAFITLDAIVPASPMAGEMVSARVSAGVCDSIIEADGYPQITQTGNAIRMLLETTYYDDPILCNSLPGTINIPFGQFAPGTYSLQLDRHYVDFLGAHVIETVGTASFVIRGAPEATPLPTLGAGSLILMGLGMLALAELSRTRHAATNANQ